MCNLGGKYFNKFPNPHIRTSSFLIYSQIFLDFMADKKTNSKLDAWKLESGIGSLTNYFKDKNYNIYVVNSDGDTSYVAYNSDPNTKKVTFSNGFSFDVPGKETKVFNRSMPADTIGRPETTPDFNFLKVISIFSEEYETATNIQLALDSTSTTEANFKSIDGNNVIVLENLDSQRIEFESKLDLSTRTNLYFNVWSEIASDLKITLLQDDNSSKQVTILTSVIIYSKIFVQCF